LLSNATCNRYTPDADLVHKWAMSAVRYLGGPEHGRELVKRVRLHQTRGVPGKARLLLVASSLRSGGALLNEMLETTADHPVDSKIWYREVGAVQQVERKLDPEL
jgi:DNA-binding response OmpR family regulator